MTIDGVSNVRGMTFNGSYIYAGNNTDSILVIDPFNETLEGYIIAPQPIRYVTFDPSADNNNGGLWIGNFNSDPALIDLSGNIIRSIPYSSLGSNDIYGAAYDFYSSDGPFLWLWGQGEGEGSPQIIMQVNPSTGLFTGVQYDISSDPVIGQDSLLAGGLFITDSFFPGKIGLGGVIQGSPDILFIYDITGSPSVNAPVVTTSSATNVTENSATLNGTVNPNNSLTTVIFEYGTTTAYGNQIAAIESPVSGSTAINVSADLTGLLLNTTYHYRVQGSNNEGVSWGSDKTFSTSITIIFAPTVTTSSATNITESTATLNGVVNPNNSSTSVTFEYGTTTSYGNQITAIQSPISGSIDVNVSADITGLSPNTTYHYRVVGNNEGGISDGTDAVFATSISCICTIC